MGGKFLSQFFENLFFVVRVPEVFGSCTEAIGLVPELIVNPDRCQKGFGKVYGRNKDAEIFVFCGSTKGNSELNDAFEIVIKRLDCVGGKIIGIFHDGSLTSGVDGEIEFAGDIVLMGAGGEAPFQLQTP